MHLFGPFFQVSDILARGFAGSLFKDIIEGRFRLESTLQGMDQQGKVITSWFQHTFLEGFYPVVVHIFIEVPGKASVDSVGNQSGIPAQEF